MTTLPRHLSAAVDQIDAAYHADKPPARKTSFLRSRQRRAPSSGPLADCALCGRPFQRLANQFKDHCSSACARLDKQRKARAA